MTKLRVTDTAAPGHHIVSRGSVVICVVRADRLGVPAALSRPIAEAMAEAANRFLPGEAA